MSTSATAAHESGRLTVPGLCLGSFVTVLTFAAPAPFFTVMARDLHTTVPLLGQVSAAMLVMSAALGLLIGPLADRYGHRRLILFGLMAAAATQLVYGVTPTFQILFLASITGALADATVPGLSLAIATTRFSGTAARRAVGWTVAALASAAIIGVPILTTIAGFTTWRTAFLSASLSTLVVTALVARWLPADTAGAASSLRLRTVLGSYRPLRHDDAMLRLFACGVLRAVCWFGFLTYLGAFLDERLGLSTPQVGLVYMLGGSGYFLGSLAAAGPLARVAPMPLLALGNSVMAIAAGVVYTGALGTALTIALIPVLAFAGAVGWVGLVGLLADRTPLSAGTTMVLNGSLTNVGAFGGSAIGGALLALSGYTGLAIGLPVFGLLSAIVAGLPGRDRSLGVSVDQDDLAAPAGASLPEPVPLP
jgi:MFS transporter, DHA1 family, inner membrane transport protein